MIKYLLPLVILLFCGVASAQDEMIVLSPFTVSSDKASTKPPVVLRKRADFLLLEITLANDTREEERRRDEVYATLHGMVTSIPANSKIELFTQEFALTSSNFQIPLVDVESKRDASNATLYAKVPLADGDDAGMLSEKLRTFVRSVKVQGRTEIFTGDIGLSIKNPEKYRYEVIQAIAADVRKLREAFGDTFEITVKGLDARLQWQRTSISDVELYLPFKYELYPVRLPKVQPIEK
ncbi:MAG: hypothetical protein QM715_13070 [Nibricoccus sp.]